MATLETSKLSKISKWVIGLSCLAYIILDVFWATNAEHGDTISEVTLAFGHKWMFIPAAFGVLVGHLFWPTSKRIEHKWARIGLLWAIGLVVIAADILGWASFHPVLVVAVFTPVGHLLWPQTTYESL